MIMLMAATATIAPPLVARTAPATVIRLGLTAMLPSLALLASAIATSSLALFILATALAGAALGLAFQGALRQLRTIPSPRHAELFSAYYTAAYLGMIGPVVGEGILADHATLTTTVTIFAAVIAALALTAALITRAAAPWRKPQSPGWNGAHRHRSGVQRTGTRPAALHAAPSGGRSDRLAFDSRTSREERT
jgi:predicted MFS family arabinose efflux permease